MNKTVEKQVISRIYGNGRGWAFSAKDFADLGRVDMALIRLAEKSTIRRVIRGIYDYPRYSELLKQELSPDIHQIAKALARKFGWKIQPSGATAMNLIGLSTQIPSQYLFQSDGPTRNYNIGKTNIQFKHRAKKETGFRNEESGIIVEALKSLGEKNTTRATIIQLRNWLPESKRTKVLKDTVGVTDWVYAVIKKVCREDTSG